MLEAAAETDGAARRRLRGRRLPNLLRGDGPRHAGYRAATSTPSAPRSRPPRWPCSQTSAPPRNLRDLVGRIAPRPLLLIAAPNSGHGEELNRGYYEAAGAAQGRCGRSPSRRPRRGDGRAPGRVRAARGRVLRPRAGRVDRPRRSRTGRGPPGLAALTPRPAAPRLAAPRPAAASPRSRRGEAGQVLAPRLLGVGQPAPAEGVAQRVAAAAARRRAREMRACALAALLGQQVEHGPAEQVGVAHAGRERRVGPLAQPPRDGRARVRGLARVPLGGAGLQPRPADVARERRHPEGRRQARVVQADDELRVQRGRGQQVHLARAGDVRRARGQQPRREHVDRVGAEPAHEVAPRGRGDHPAQQRQVGLGGGQRRVRAVDDDLDLVGQRDERLGQPLARALEQLEQAGHVLVVGQLVAGGEVRRSGSRPRAPQDVAQRGPLARSPTLSRPRPRARRSARCARPCDSRIAWPSRGRARPDDAPRAAPPRRSPPRVEERDAPAGRGELRPCAARRGSSRAPVSPRAQRSAIALASVGTAVDGAPRVGPARPASSAWSPRAPPAAATSASRVGDLVGRQLAVAARAEHRAEHGHARRRQLPGAPRARPRRRAGWPAPARRRGRPRRRRRRAGRRRRSPARDAATARPSAIAAGPPRGSTSTVGSPSSSAMRPSAKRKPPGPAASGPASATAVVQRLDAGDLVQARAGPGAGRSGAAPRSGRRAPTACRSAARPRPPRPARRRHHRRRRCRRTGRARRAAGRPARSGSDERRRAVDHAALDDRLDLLVGAVELLVGEDRACPRTGGRACTSQPRLAAVEVLADLDRHRPRDAVGAQQDHVQRVAPLPRQALLGVVRRPHVVRRQRVDRARVGDAPVPGDLGPRADADAVGLRDPAVARQRVRGRLAVGPDALLERAAQLGLVGRRARRRCAGARRSDTGRSGRGRARSACAPRGCRPCAG